MNLLYKTIKGSSLCRICGNINSKNTGQFQQAVFNPLSAMFEVFPGKFILATKKGASHTTGNAMIIRVASRDTNDFLGFGIMLSLADCLHQGTNLPGWCQLNLWVSLISCKQTPNEHINYRISRCFRRFIINESISSSGSSFLNSSSSCFARSNSP